MLPIARILPFVVLVCCLPGSGCAEDDGLDPEDAWAGRTAEAMCAAAFDRGCGCMPTFYDSQAGCEDSRHETMRRDQLSAIRDGDVFDPACADEHIDAIDDLGCEPTAEFLESGVAPTCQIYHGTKKVDEACSVYYSAISGGPILLGLWMSDCEQGLLCVLNRCAEPGADPPIAAPGGECFDTEVGQVAVCSEGEECNFVSGLCTPPAALGESCDGGIPCVDSWCDQGTCAAPQPDGASCQIGSECESGYCASGTCAEYLNPEVIACSPWAL